MAPALTDKNEWRRQSRMKSAMPIINFLIIRWSGSPGVKYWVKQFIKDTWELRATAKVSWYFDQENHLACV